MTKKIVFLCTFIAASAFLFQNCSDSVSFDSEKSQASTAGPEGTNNSSEDPASPDDSGSIGSTPGNGKTPGGSIVICNPLDPTEVCSDPTIGQGLMGKLYYMTPAIHGALFNDNLKNAKIDDYRNHGIQVPIDLVMSSVNITPRSWQTGFKLPNGEQVKKQNGEELFEWFHIDMSGFINLPAGSYEFAILSDDGMRVTLNGEVVLNDDGVHGPRYQCASSMTDFVDGEKKMIRVQYFQGPRTRISMQLLIRPASKGNLPCGSSGEFMPIDSAAFSRN